VLLNNTVDLCDGADMIRHIYSFPEAAVNELPDRVRRLLHRTIHIIVITRHDTRQAGRSPLYPVDVCQSLPPLRNGRTAERMRQPATK
jgi:hypothetical protein